VAGFTGEADRFWTAVLVAGFGSYGPLPWWPTRPPRAIERAIERMRFAVRSMNLHVLSRASVQWNTFPSGHVATSLAAALAVASVLPSAGLVIAVIALAIAVASVVGRYHYAADALAGALLAAIGFGVSRLV
jgi:membrane-associated phospholipid phosphatase